MNLNSFKLSEQRHTEKSTYELLKYEKLICSRKKLAQWLSLEVRAQIDWERGGNFLG